MNKPINVFGRDISSSIIAAVFHFVYYPAMHEKINVYIGSDN
jgi:hypothetical protein